MNESTTVKVTVAFNIWNASRHGFYQQEDTMTDLEQLRYPVGRWARPKPPLDRATRSGHIETIAQLPANMSSLTQGRDAAALDTPSRACGGTAAQGCPYRPARHMNTD